MAELDLKNYKNRHSTASKIARVMWNVVWLILFRPTPNRIGIFSAWRVFLLRLFGAKIGKHCVVMNSVLVWQPWKFKMGDYSCLSEGVNCYTVDQITIGNQTTVSREAFLCCASHDVTSPIMELTYAPITIGCNAWLGARAFICPGITVGDGAVVAACGVATKDVEPWTVVGGNSAKVIKKRELLDNRC